MPHVCSVSALAAIDFWNVILENGIKKASCRAAESFFVYSDEVALRRFASGEFTL